MQGWQFSQLNYTIFIKTKAVNTQINLIVWITKLYPEDPWITEYHH